MVINRADFSLILNKPTLTLSLSRETLNKCLISRSVCFSGRQEVHRKSDYICISAAIIITIITAVGLLSYTKLQ